MRKLWEDHITWTRLFIVSASADLPDKQATTERLLRNQQDIGDAIKPFYGRAAGERLSALLTEHILGPPTSWPPPRRATRRRSSATAGPGTATATRSPTSCTGPTRATGREGRCGR